MVIASALGFADMHVWWHWLIAWLFWVAVVNGVAEGDELMYL